MFAAGPVGNAHDPSTWEMETDIRFWVSLGYVWSSRPVWAVPVSESKTRWREAHKAPPSLSVFRLLMVAR